MSENNLFAAKIGFIIGVIKGIYESIFLNLNFSVNDMFITAIYGAVGALGAMAGKEIYIFIKSKLKP